MTLTIIGPDHIGAILDDGEGDTPEMPCEPRAGCTHPPTAKARTCGCCGVLIFPWEVRWCSEGHWLQVRAGSPATFTMWCFVCQRYEVVSR